MIKQFIKLVIFLTVGFGLGWGGKYIYHWSNSPQTIEHGDYGQYYLPSDSAKVILYATDWCQFCKKTRELFAENQIDYVELNIENTERGMKQYLALRGKGVPLILIEDVRINGYHAGKINQVLKEKKLIN